MKKPKSTCPEVRIADVVAKKLRSEWKKENRTDNKILKELKNMADQIEDLQAVITALQTAIDADVEQDTKVVEAVNALKAKIDALPNAPPDLQPSINALVALTTKLSSDNQAVQDALDKAAEGQVPPPQA